MLVKKELLSTPLNKAPKLSKQIKNDYPVCSSVSIVKLPRSGKVLSVDFYTTDNLTLIARFFVNKDSKQFTTWDCFENKWVQRACCKTVETNSKSHANIKDYQDDKSRKTVFKYFNMRDTGERISYCYCHSSRWVYVNGPFAIIEKFCQAIRDERSSKAARTRWEKNERLHSMFNDILPKKVDKYCDKNIFPANYIFFSKLNKERKRKGHCSCCGKSFVLPESVKHNEYTHCPKCGHEAFYCAEHFAKSRNDKSSLYYITKKGDNILYQFFDVSRHYNNELEPVLYYSELYRTVYDTKTDKHWSSSYKFQRYYWGDYWTNFQSWLPDRHYGYVYPDTLNDIYRKIYPHLNFSELLGKLKKPISIIRLLRNIEQYYVTEYFLKAGLKEFAAEVDMQTLNYMGNSFSDVLGVTKQYLSMYKEMCVTPDEHYIIASAREFVTPELLNDYRQLHISENDSDRVITALEYMSLRKFINYFNKQKAVVGKMDMASKFDNRYYSSLENHILVCLSDYISMSEEIGVTLTKYNLFPKNIHIAHEQITPRANEIRKEREEKDSKEALAIVNDFFKEYKRDGYIIVVPKTRQDFIIEGQNLSHCVGGQSYYNNHIAGKKMIFFIRKVETPKTSYVTAEIDMRSFVVTQCYGYHDKPAPAPVKKFVKGFARWLQSQKSTLRKAG